MYLQYGDSLTDEAVQAWALEHYGSSVVIRQTIERFHEGVVPVLSDRPDATPLVVSVGNKLRELLSDKSRLGKRHLAFFAKHRALLEATDGPLCTRLRLLSYGRDHYLLGDLGYIDEELLGELLEARRGGMQSGSSALGLLSGQVPSQVSSGLWRSRRSRVINHFVQ